MTGWKNPRGRAHCERWWTKYKEWKGTCNIIYNSRSRRFIGVRSRHLAYEDRIYVENFVMNLLGLESKPIQVQRIGVFTKQRALKARYRHLKVSLESDTTTYQTYQNSKVKTSRLPNRRDSNLRSNKKEWDGTKQDSQVTC